MCRSKNDVIVESWRDGQDNVGRVTLFKNKKVIKVEHNSGAKDCC